MVSIAAIHAGALEQVRMLWHSRYLPLLAWKLHEQGREVDRRPSSRMLKQMSQSNVHIGCREDYKHPVIKEELHAIMVTGGARCI